MKTVQLDDKLAHKLAHVQKMLDAQTAAAASKEVEKITTKMKDFVPEWDQVVALKKAKSARTLEQDVQEHIDISRQIKELQAIKDGITERVKATLIKGGVPSVMVNGAKVTKVDGKRGSLDKQALVRKHGLEVLDWLEEATVYQPTTSLLITPPKEGK